VGILAWIEVEPLLLMTVKLIRLKSFGSDGNGKYLKLLSDNLLPAGKPATSCGQVPLGIHCPIQYLAFSFTLI